MGTSWRSPGLGPATTIVSRSPCVVSCQQSLACTYRTFLYSEIQWKWLEFQIPPIAALLRTILRRPEVAAHVRRLKLLGGYIRDTPFRGDLVPKISTVGLELDGAVVIDKIGVPSADRWKRDLGCGTTDAFVALLVSKLHKRDGAFGKAI